MLYYYSACDAPIENLNLGFQDPASPQMEGLIGLHSDIWASMMFIAGFVTFVLVTIIKSKFTRSFKLNHNNLIEVIWTTVPAMLLCVIATPSFTLLYGLDEIVLPNLTLKAIGRQWYWSYEYGDFNLVFDSNLLPDDELSQGQLRLLEVDNRLVVPVNQPIRLLTSAGDVIHSFAVPSLGLKLDAIPGWLNQTIMFVKRQGVFYGQCSELCGSGHSMMPIVVEAVDQKDYLNWLNAKLTD